MQWVFYWDNRVTRACSRSISWLQRSPWRKTIATPAVMMLLPPDPAPIVLLPPDPVITNGEGSLMLWWQDFWDSVPLGGQWLVRWGLPLASVWVGLFLAVGLSNVHSPTCTTQGCGWQVAVNEATITQDPFQVNEASPYVDRPGHVSHRDDAGTDLAVAEITYTVFLVPALIGSAVALLVAMYLDRRQRPPVEVLRELSPELDTLEQRVAAMELAEVERQAQPEQAEAQRDGDGQ